MDEMNTSRNLRASRLCSLLTVLQLLGCATSQPQVSSNHSGRLPSQEIKPPHVPARGGIVGTVVDADTGSPLQNAYVMIVTREPIRTATAALTAAQGQFDVERPPGSYEIQVEKAGYQTSSTTGLTVMPDQDLLVTVKLKRGDPKDGTRLATDHMLEPPVLVSGPNPEYTSAGLQHGIQGLMIIVCSITVEGAVQDCYARKGLPYMDDAVIAALQARKYKPARRDGQPIEVTYTFKIKLTLPGAPLRTANQRLLDEGYEELQAKDYQRARSLFAAALASPEFGSLTTAEQHWVLHGAAHVAWKLGLGQEGLQFARRAFAMREVSVEDFYLRRDSGRLLGDRREGVVALTELARRDKTLLATLYNSDVYAILKDARALPKSDGAYLELMQTLFDVGYRRRSGVPADSIWRELAAMLLERGETGKAEQVALHFSNRESIIVARADRRFAAIVALHPQQFDWKEAIERRVEQFRNEVREKTRSLTAVFLLAGALADAGRQDEGLEVTTNALLAIEAARPSNPYSDAKEIEPQLRERRAGMLWALGRWDDAVDELRRGAELPEEGGKNTSQNLALADRYCSLGRGQEALAAARAAEEGGLSPWGRMMLEKERAVASDILGDASGREAALAYLRLHEKEGPAALQDALLRTGDLDGAARVLEARLADPVERLDALYALQNYTRGPHSLWGGMWAARRNELLARPDVHDAVSRVGRIETYDLPAE